MKYLIYALCFLFLPVAVNAQSKKDPFKNAKKGIVDNIEFPVGTPITTVLKKWGKPKEQGRFSGGYYLTYNEIIFFTDGDTVNNGNISVITIKKGSLCGIKIGTRPSVIRAKLGKPDYDNMASEGNEFNQDDWILVYYRGKYSITFASKSKDSPTIYGDIYKYKDRTPENSKQ